MMLIPAPFLFVTVIFIVSVVFHEADGHNKPKKKCKNPKGNHGSMKTYGCLKLTCFNGKWKTTINDVICCHDRKAYEPNTTISHRTAHDGCTTTTLKCEMEAKFAKIVFKHSTNCTDLARKDQVDKLSAKIVNLTQLLVNHISDTGDKSCSSGEIPVSMTTTEIPTTTTAPPQEPPQSSGQATATVEVLAPITAEVKSHFITGCTSNNDGHFVHRDKACKHTFDGNSNTGWTPTSSPGFSLFHFEEAVTMNTIIFRGGSFQDFSVGVKKKKTVIPITLPLVSDENAIISPKGRIRLSNEYISGQIWVRIGIPEKMADVTGVEIRNFGGGRMTQLWLLELSGIGWREDIEGITTKLMPNKINPSDQHSGNPIIKSYFITGCTSNNDVHFVHRDKACKHTFDGNANTGWTPTTLPGFSLFHFEEAVTMNTIIFRGGTFQDFSVSVEKNKNVIPITSPLVSDGNATFSPSGRIRLSYDYVKDQIWVRIGIPEKMADVTGLEIRNFGGGRMTQLWLLELAGIGWSEDIEGITTKLIPNRINPSDQHTGNPIIISHFITGCTSNNDVHFVHMAKACKHTFDGNSNTGWTPTSSPGFSLFHFEEAVTMNTIIFRGVSFQDFSVGVEKNKNVIPITSPLVSDGNATFSPSGRIRLSYDYIKDQIWVRIGIPEMMDVTGIEITNFGGGQMTQLWLLKLEGVDWSQDIEDIIKKI